jgi:outer membrane protein assembly factor BamB
MPSNTVGGDISRRVLLGALAGTALLGSTRVQGRQNLDENAGKKQYQGDRANTGYIPEECPPTANVRKEWEIDPDELRTTDMAIITTANVTYGFDESVYVVGKHRGAILDVDPESGSVGARWRADDFDGELTTPAAWNGVLYVGAGENDAGFEGTHGVVYAVDLYDEGTVWRSGVGRGPAYVTASNDLYVGSKGALYALDAREGSGLWTDVPDDADAQVGYPAVAGETVVYATDAGGVYALGEGGNRQWSADVGGGGTHVSVDDGVVYAGSADAPSVRALDLSGGSVRWETAIAGPVTHPPAVAGGRVYTFVRENGEVDGAGVLTALDAATGDRLWEFRTTSVYIGPRPPLVSRDAVLVVGNPKPYDNLNTAVYVVDAASGDRRARIDLRQDPGTSAPVVLEDTLYVADNSVGIGYLSAHVGER